MNFSWAMDLDPKGASNQIKELIDRHYGNEDEIMIHSNNNTSGNSSGANMDSSYVSSSSMIGSANNSASFTMIHTTPFQQRSTLTPTGPGGAGPSGSGSSVQSGSASTSVNSSNSNNGSNNSNNISNNNAPVIRGTRQAANIIRRYNIIQYNADVDEGERMESEEEEEEEEAPEEEEVEETFDDSSELAESSHMEEGVGTFALDASANEGSPFQEDNFML